MSLPHPTTIGSSGEHVCLSSLSAPAPRVIGSACARLQRECIPQAAPLRADGSARCDLADKLGLDIVTRILYGTVYIAW